MRVLSSFFFLISSFIFLLRPTRDLQILLVLPGPGGLGCGSGAEAHPRIFEVGDRKLDWSVTILVVRYTAQKTKTEKTNLSEHERNTTVTNGTTPTEKRTPGSILLLSS